MKKRIAWVGLLLAMVMLLASCSSMMKMMPPPLTAGQLSRRVNFNLASLDGYRVDVESTYKFYMGTRRVQGTLEGVVIEDQGKDKDDYYFYTEMTNRMQYNGEEIRIRIFDAYGDGMAYTSYTEGRTRRSLCASMSVKEYKRYMEGDSLLGFSEEDCKNAELDKTEQGYIAKFSGYSQEALDSFANASGFGEDAWGDTLQDIVLTMEVGKDYMPIKSTLELVFDSPSTSFIPSLSMTMTYSQFDSVERTTRSMNADSYTEIESLQLLEDLQELIDDKINAKKGSFTYTMKQKASVLSQSDSYDVTNEVTFKNGKDGFSFENDVSTKEDGHTSHISYANGERSMDTNGKVHTSEMTDDEAHKYVAELINDPALGYLPQYVSDIEQTEDGYLVTMAVSKDSALGQAVASMGAGWANGEHTVKFEMVDGELVAILSEFSARGSVQTNLGGSVTLHFDGSIQVQFEE